MITEKNNVFYCDCGFSFQRGRSGAHDCADGLRNKLAESEARCSALAAENAGLKSAIDATIGWQQSTDPENVESVRMLVDIKTPATDAFLAEVQASGVDAAIEHLINKFEGTGHIGVPVMALEWLAQELRKGAQS